jgi:low temperature requirement protein LtrA
MIAAGSEHGNLHPEHFCERHGLLVIIALGETLIVAAGGGILYAVAMEEAVAHASDPLHLSARTALAAAILLFVGGVAFAMLRTGQRAPVPRLIIVLYTAITIVFVSAVAGSWTPGIALVGIAVITMQEERSPPRPARRSLP